GGGTLALPHDWGPANGLADGLKEMEWWRDGVAVCLLLAQPDKLLCAADGIGNGILPTDDNWCGRIGGPNHRQNQVRGGLQSVACVISWPRQKNICSGRNDCQLRSADCHQGKAEHRAMARTAA